MRKGLVFLFAALLVVGLPLSRTGGDAGVSLSRMSLSLELSAMLLVSMIRIPGTCR